MPKIQVKRSIEIEKPASEIFHLLNDFHNWTSWSPWLIAEPEAKVDVAKDGKSYAWNGEVTGSGKMKVNSEKENEYIEYDLTFLKPFKSEAKTAFSLKEKAGKTELSWTMDSSLPFFLFFMTKSMETYIGMDYERGLKMIKDLAEDGKVHSSLDFVGEKEFVGGRYIGIKTSGKFSEIEKLMTADFEALFTYKNSQLIDNTIGNGISIYHKVDPVKDKVSYTAGIFVNDYPAQLPNNFIKGEVATSKVYSIKHTGPYNHIGNIWAAGIMHQRAKKFKTKRAYHPMEIYHNSPKNTNEKELITEVVFGAR